MQVSTKLFNQQQVGQFGKLNTNIADIQERISTGKNILRASDDPVAAANLSVAKEQSLLLSQFQRNIDSAETRLNMTDHTLQEGVNVLVRLSELSTMARNGALNAEGHMAITTEMKQLKEVLLGLANTTDAHGVGIFSGYNAVSRPFEMEVDGSVTYLGNRGQNNLQISENMTVATNIDGGSAFMRVDANGTRQSVFDIVNSTINTVNSASAIAPQADANWSADIEFELPSRMEKWSFSLTGSKGTVEKAWWTAFNKFGNNMPLRWIQVPFWACEKKETTVAAPDANVGSHKAENFDMPEMLYRHGCMALPFMSTNDLPMATQLLEGNIGESRSLSSTVSSGGGSSSSNVLIELIICIRVSAS